MVIYNVTVNIDEACHDEWLQWMREDHIPEVMRTEMFIESRLSKILAESEGGVSYSIQYLAKDMATYERYMAEFAPQLQQDHIERFAGKFVAFRTLLDVVQQF